MSLYFLDDIFLLYFPLESSERILYTFAFLKSDFSQSITPPVCGRYTEMNHPFYCIFN